MEYELFIEALEAEFNISQEEWEQLKNGAFIDGVGLGIKITPKRKNTQQPYATIVLNPETIQNPDHTEVKDLFFGLFILGTEKHESRRIDNQLRGRAGRQ